MTRLLDKNRAFGVVVGASDGTAFHQDGHCFRPDGTEVGAPVVVPAPVPVAAETAAAAPDIPAPAGVTREELKALHPSQIKKLILAEGLELIVGPGSKAKNIEQLLAGE